MITWIIGRLGAGKSTIMTSLLYDAHLKGRECFANYLVKFPCEPVDLEDIFQTEEVIPKYLWNSTIAWDEATSTGFDSRDSAMRITKEGITDFVYQSRKADIEFMYCSKRPMDIESRLRDNVSLVILCRAIPPFGKPRMFVYRFAIPPEYVLGSLYGIGSFEEIHRSIIPADHPAVLKTWELFESKRIIDAKKLRRQKRELNVQLKAQTPKRKRKKVKHRVDDLNDTVWG